jgi:hypothetical protein
MVFTMEVVVEGEGEVLVEDFAVGACLSVREEIGSRVAVSAAELQKSSLSFDMSAGVVVPSPGWMILIGTLRLFGSGGDTETGCGV